MANVNKVSVFVDGFNLYHSIDALNKNSPENKNYLKWVNLKSLSEKFINHACEEICTVVYFSAIADFHRNPEVPKRHRIYIKALESVGVKFIEGNFKKKKDNYEEKETDVNIALAILEDAYEKTSDKILLITNDSDISPAIRMARLKNPKLKINVITPPTASPNYDLIQSAGDFVLINNGKGKRKFYGKTRIIQELHLKKSLFEKEISYKGKVITRPDKYNPPE